VTAGVARSFTRRLREEAAPALAELGFVFDGSRTFRRFPAHRACVQIINYQLGERFMSGRFTVNVAVYDPARCVAQVDAKKALEHHCAAPLRQRVGLLIPSRLRPLERLPIVGTLFRPRDTWWAADDATAIVAAMDAVVTYGLAWLEAHTPARTG
jgi:hypothetical protein